MVSKFSDTGAFLSDCRDFEHKPLGALPVPRLSEIEENRIQEAVHAGERPGAFINDGKQVLSFTGDIGKSAHQ